MATTTTTIESTNDTTTSTNTVSVDIDDNDNSNSNVEYVDEGVNLARTFSIWRSVASIAAAVGVVIQVPFQIPCGLVGVAAGQQQPSSLSENAFCAPWLEPPIFASSAIGLASMPSTTSLFASAVGAGCTLYALVLAYYAVVLLPSVGRSGRAERPALMDLATPIGLWQALGFLDRPPPGTTKAGGPQQ
uniref:Uncharacterized protein n=1 Tax=Pseudo-nitzschia australis TaxID=44445 RepID=A0A7S4ALE7_9STRA